MRDVDAVKGRKTEDGFHRTEESKARESRRCTGRDESVVRGSPENCKSDLAISSASEAHVFDDVLKHGWPSAPCHGASMAEKKIF
jgi:hypothetical protein